MSLVIDFVYCVCAGAKSGSETPTSGGVGSQKFIQDLGKGNLGNLEVGANWVTYFLDTNYHGILGLKVTLCPSTFEEDLDPSKFNSFSEFVEETALQKVLEVESRLTREGRAPDVVIGADTMVTLDGRMFGKPTDRQDAFDMLSSLSGKGHTVYTGVVIKTSSEVVKFTENTKVFFGDIDEEQIKAYIDTGEPMDKAGGYGIQGVGGTFVERVEGDYFTVVGLPLYRISSVLYNMFKNLENKLN